MGLPPAAENVWAFGKLQTSTNLEDAYEHLYAILQVMAFAKPLKNADPAIIRPFFQDASATLMLLSQCAATRSLPAQSQLLQQTDERARSWLVRLTHLDETGLAQYNQHYLTDMREAVDTVAEKELAKLNYVWAGYYLKRNTETDEKIVEKRRQVEARCANLFADILCKNPDTLTLEEQSLVMRAMSDYDEHNSATPFYNAIRLLAISYHDAGAGVVLLGKEPAKTRESEVRQKLYAQLSRCLFNYDDTKLTRQQRRLDKRLWESIEKIEPKMSAFGGNYDDDTKSVVSRVSQLSAKSGYSYRSAGSARSGNSTTSSMNLRGPEDKVAMAYVEFQMVWNSLWALRRPLKKREAKFILKNYEAVCQNTDIDKIQSTQLLYRAFDWLHLQPSTKHGGGFFSSGPQVDVPSEDCKGLMGYMAPKKVTPELFAQYCLYQVQKKTTGYVMKSYEITFILSHLKHLYIHKEALNQLSVTTSSAALGEYLAPTTGQRNTSVISLVYAAWDKEINQLEEKGKKGTLTKEEVESHRERLRDNTDPKQPKRIVFETPLGGKENKSLSERITALRNRADELFTIANAKKGLIK